MIQRVADKETPMAEVSVILEGSRSIIAIKIPSITSNNTLTQDTIDKLR